MAEHRSEAEAYRSDPCGTLSIPYWKSRRVSVPPQMRIVHERDFSPAYLSQYTDEPYFRLRHDLQRIAPPDEAFVLRTAREEDDALLAEVINRSYDDLSVTEEQLKQYRCTPVFMPALWVIASDARTQAVLGCGLADLDADMSEGVLEWIQVLPEYRGRGAGKAIVCELLRRMAGCASFATVSGRVNSASQPEKLYRACGFSGSDVWHILTKKT